MGVSFVARKCTQCAGRLQYIKEKKLWKCLYCGAEIERQEQYDGLFTIKNVVRQCLLDTAFRRLDSAAKNLVECEKIDSRYVGTLIAKITHEMISVITPGACSERDVRNLFAQLKKNYEALKIGEQLQITATDQAFGKDVTSWCKMTGAELVALENKNGVVAATIRKQEKTASCEISRNNADNKTLIVFSDDLDKALASFVIANGAASTGKKVTMFFTFWGLNVIKKQHKPTVTKDIFGKMFGWMLPTHSGKLKLSKMNMGGAGSWMMRLIMKRKRIDSLESLIQQAIDNGVEMIACTMSMDVMGVQKEELMDNVTLGGVASYLERAEEANVNLFI